MYYYCIVLGHYKKPLPKHDKLSRFERDAMTLFQLMDYDSSGYITVVELVKVLKWMGTRIDDGEKWIKVMFLALPLEEGADEKNAKDPGAPDIAADPTNEEILKMVNELEFVEGGQMNLKEFTAWLKIVTKSFEESVYNQAIAMLTEYLRKEQEAINLFRTWDVDNSGQLDTAELKRIVEHFKRNFQPTAQEFAQLEDCKGYKSVEDWKKDVSSQLDELGSVSSLKLPEFKMWLLAVCGQLSKETYDRAMGEMLALVTKSISTDLLFKVWDRDGSGALDFAEIGQVLQWFSENIPGETGKVDMARLFASLQAPPDGKMTLKLFDEWFMAATTGMSPYTVTVITEKLKQRLREMGIDPAAREATRKADEQGTTISRKVADAEKEEEEKPDQVEITVTQAV